MQALQTLNQTQRCVWGGGGGELTLELLLEQVTEHGKGACEMAQWVEAPAAKPDDLSSVPTTHRVKRENQLPLVVL